MVFEISPFGLVLNKQAIYEENNRIMQVALFLSWAAVYRMV